jgi:hypothetical protein
LRGFPFNRAALAQHLTKTEKIKPISDVYFIQKLTEISGGKANQHQSSEKLPKEI